MYQLIRTLTIDSTVDDEMKTLVVVDRHYRRRT